jgi:hypothetical protein
MSEMCVAGTVVNQIHADLKSEKSERGGADKEDRRRELNFPDRQVPPLPPPPHHSHLRKVGYLDPHSSGCPGSGSGTIVMITDPVPGQEPYYFIKVSKMIQKKVHHFIKLYDGVLFSMATKMST